MKVRFHKRTWEARAMIQGASLNGYGATREEAIAALERKVQQWETRFAKLNAATFKSYMETAYMPTIAHRSKAHREQMMWALNHLEPFHGLPLAEVSRDKLQRHFNGLLGKLSLQSVVHVKKLVGAVLELAVADGHIQFNPARYLKLPDLAPVRRARRAEPLTPAELRQAILDAQRANSSALPAIVLCGLLGLGYEEIRAITPASWKRGNVLQVTRMKTIHRYRELPVPSAVVDLLKGCRYPLIPASNSSTSKAMKRATDVRLSRHILRHTCATGLQELGCPDEVRNLILGHAGRGMAAHYAHGKLMEVKRGWLEQWAETVLNALPSTIDLGADLGAK